MCWLITPHSPLTKARRWQDLRPQLDDSRVQGNMFPDVANFRLSPNGGVSRRRMPRRDGHSFIREMTCPIGYRCIQKRDAQRDAHIFCKKDLSTVPPGKTLDPSADEWLRCNGDTGHSVFAPIPDWWIKDAYHDPPCLRGSSSSHKHLALRGSGH